MIEKDNQPAKDSDNSSPPPSKGRYPKRKPELDENGNPIKGKPGAKKGHQAFHRKKANSKNTDSADQPLELTGQDIPTEEVEIRPDFSDCPECGAKLVHSKGRDHHFEQIELVDNPLLRKNYTSEAYRCPDCGKIHYGQKPATLATGLLGPKLIAWLGFIKGGWRISVTGIQKILATFGLSVSRGYISETLDKCADSLGPAYNDLKEALPSQKKLSVDETLHRENGNRLWTWVFRAETFAFFAIKEDRSADVLVECLTKDFNGLISRAYFSASRKPLRLFPFLKTQFYQSYLRRDLKFLADHLEDLELREYGAKLVTLLNELFAKNRLWRQLRRPRNLNDSHGPDFEGEDLEGEDREAKAKTLLEEMRDLAVRLKAAALDCPNKKKAKNIAKRFLDWLDDFYFKFLTNAGVAIDLGPTNNVEQAVRLVVMDLQVTQGTRSLKGRIRSERLWTVIASCAIQLRSPFEFIKDSVRAHYCQDREYPSLLEKDK
ncbi:MAG: IS66 family transposase [Deltaproteobacteria bacterium]|jgi:transposase|nr:IS66 family transposase [Deltaproteobacteria bacterium]